MKKETVDDMKKNNKGFSLVELIIVIAIIAILATVLVPQYLRYVEEARQASDLQVASNIVRAARVAIVDPDSELPFGQFVELLWITGDESGSRVTKGSIMIRHNDGYRTSVFNDGEGDDDVPPTSGDVESLRAFATIFFESLGMQDAVIHDDPDWLQVMYKDAESDMANEANFSIHINTGTGEVALADYPSTVSSTADPNRWVDLGLHVTPAP